MDTYKKLRTTAVSRNGEKCSKFTFFFRKRYYHFSRKYIAKVRQFLKLQNAKALIYNSCFFMQNPYLHGLFLENKSHLFVKKNSEVCKYSVIQSKYLGFY